jgi:hypothetical protein
MTGFIIVGRGEDGTMYMGAEGGWHSSRYEPKPMTKPQAEGTLAAMRVVERSPDQIWPKAVIKPGPYNPEIHAHLVELGYERTWYEDSFEDDGDGESGPHLIGGPAYEEYASATDYIFFVEGGHFAHYQLRDLEMEKFVDQMMEGQP